MGQVKITATTKDLVGIVRLMYALDRKLTHVVYEPLPIRWWHVLFWFSPGYFITLTFEELNKCHPKDTAGNPKEDQKDCC